MLEKLAWRIRNGIIVVGLLCGIVSISVPHSHAHAEVKEDECESSEFWPPDLIPHPHLPGKPKKDERELSDVIPLYIRPLVPEQHYKSLDLPR